MTVENSRKPASIYSFRCSKERQVAAAIHELVHMSILALILCQEEICDKPDKRRQ
jgi:hypothetical protein